MLTLTCPNLGLQAASMLLMSSGTPYLRSLGLSDAVAALIWLIGPLCGAFVQPILGILSDNSQHPWGRRKPFIVWGSFFVATCLIALAYIDTLTRRYLEVGTRQENSHLLAQILAFLLVCVISFAIQSFQIGVRTLVVDICPPEQQVCANAWNTRWSGLGSVCLLLVGYFDKRYTLFSAEDNTKLKTLAVLVAIFITATVSILCLIIPDKARIQSSNGAEVQTLWKTCKTIWSIQMSWKCWEALPPVSLQVCKVQFLAWLAWFPITYYASTGISITNTLLAILSSGVRNSESDDQLISAARLNGDLALLCFSSISVLTSLSLPLLTGYTAHRPSHSQLSRRMPLSHWLQYAQQGLGFCMLLTLFAWNVPVGISIIGTAGISWSISTWVPFALVGAEVSGIQDICLMDCGEESQAGWVMGIHNMAISFPQICSAILCSVLFKIMESLKVLNPEAWVFRMCGLIILVASSRTYKLRHLGV
ncbi:hypothetical protein LX36DRAFT_566338 [Colletotrichum falcatum]|nr:hypothetical protein LX36DRAFT_566338 [Colletotrichum falcatum]